jgi:FkbM family methyltransferase
MKEIMKLKIAALCLLCLCNPLRAEQRAFNMVKLDSIRSSKKDQIISFIKEFPFSQYKVHYTSQPGYFYLDNINDTIKNPLKTGQNWDAHITDQIFQHAKPNSYVVDIGAHIGTFTLNLSHTVGYGGKVIAFEPQPKIFRELIMNMGLNGVTNVDYYFAAVGNKEGTIELSPLNPGNEAGTAISGGTGVKVDLITLDSLKLQNVSLIKIDVEGMEDEVLDGARETIMKNKPVILIEIMGGYYYYSAPRHIQVKIEGTIEKLKGMGYTCHNLWEHDYIALPQGPKGN